MKRHAAITLTPGEVRALYAFFWESVDVFDDMRSNTDDIATIGANHRILRAIDSIEAKLLATGFIKQEGQ